MRGGLEFSSALTLERHCLLYGRDSRDRLAVTKWNNLTDSIHMSLFSLKLHTLRCN